MYIQLSRSNRQKNFLNTIPIILNAWYSYNWVYHDGALSYWMVGMMLYTVYIVMMRWWCNPIELDTQTYVCRRYRSLFSIISLLDVVVRPPIYLYLVDERMNLDVCHWHKIYGYTHIHRSHPLHVSWSKTRLLIFIVQINKEC
jgi:hypothetical protein